MSTATPPRGSSVLPPLSQRATYVADPGARAERPSLSFSATTANGEARGAYVGPAAAGDALAQVFAHASYCVRCGGAPIPGERIELAPGRPGRWQHQDCADLGPCPGSHFGRHMVVRAVRESIVVDACALCGREWRPHLPDPAARPDQG